MFRNKNVKKKEKKCKKNVDDKILVDVSWI